LWTKSAVLERLRRCGVHKVDPAGNRSVLGRDPVYAPYGILGNRLELPERVGSISVQSSSGQEVRNLRVSDSLPNSQQKGTALEGLSSRMKQVTGGE
jgi:hypothetical protein